MKKFLISILVLALSVSLVACGGGSSPASGGSTPASSKNAPEWKQFLAEYEAWVDEYVAVMEKYQANPADLSLLGDYTEMLTAASEWEAKADKMEAELEDASPAELAEYSASLLRIAGKMLNME